MGFQKRFHRNQNFLNEAVETPVCFFLMPLFPLYLLPLQLLT